MEVKVGLFKDGSPRLLTFHWSSCKPAMMSAGTKVASRPMLGRKPKDKSVLIEPTAVPEEPVAESQQKPVESSASNQNQSGGNFQTTLTSRPKRNTRNPNPLYT